MKSWGYMTDFLTTQSLFTFFGDADLDALLSWEGYQSLLAPSDDEYVAQSGGEGGSGGVLNVDDVEGTRMLVSGGDDPDSAQVVSSGDHAQVSGVELHVVGDGATFDVQDHGVVHVDVGVGVTDRSGIVGYQKWNTLLSHADFGDSAEFVSSFFWGDSVNSESAFDVVDQTEIFVRFLNGDNVHESSWVVHVRSDFTVNGYQTLHEDLLDFVSCECVVKSVSEEDD